MNGSNLNNNSSDISFILPTIKAYRRRWFVVIGLSILTMVNGALWISYANITDLTAKFYGIKELDVNMLNLVYPIATIVLSLPVAWINDLIGIRATFLAAGTLNVASSALRFSSSYVFNHNTTNATNATLSSQTPFILAMTGQTVGSLAQPLCLFSSTKVAAIWFPADQRTIANTIGSMANPLGILISSIVSPLVVQEASDLYKLDICLGVPALLGLVWTLLFVCQSSPPHPPSESALSAEVPPGQFCQQLRLCLNSRPFIVLLFSFGVGMGMFTALSSLMAQILCLRGVGDVFSGICAGLLIFCGLIGAGIVGPYVDRTKAFVGVVKVCYSLASLGILAFAILQFIDMDHTAQLVLIAISVSVIGAFGFAMYATALELGVECTYPVGETVSTALLITLGQVASVVIILLMQDLSSDPKDRSKCKIKGAKEYRYTVLGLAVLGTVVCLLTLLFLKTDYRRNRVENYISPESTLRSDSDGLEP